jgi:hypothetical protein
MISEVTLSKYVGPYVLNEGMLQQQALYGAININAVSIENILKEHSNYLSLKIKLSLCLNFTP